MACADAYVAGQASRDAGRLTVARERLSLCASDSCPRVLQGDCIEWLREVVDRLPSVVVRAVDADGRDVDALVSIDGGQAVALNGRPIELDAGAHQLEVRAAANGSVANERVVLAEREKGRIVLVTISAPGAGAASGATALRPASTQPASGPTSVVPVEPASGRTSLSPWPFVLGGVGVAALGGAGFFYLTGLDDGATLRDGCGSPPSCSQNDVDAAHRKLIVGDVLAGVGVVAIGVATLLFLTSPRKAASARRGAPGASVAF